jgi:hypothetical protein
MHPKAHQKRMSSAVQKAAADQGMSITKAELNRTTRQALKLQKQAARRAAKRPRRVIA